MTDCGRPLWVELEVLALACLGAAVYLRWAYQFTKAVWPLLWGRDR